MQHKNIISLIVLAASLHIQTSLCMEGAAGTFLRLFNSSDRPQTVIVESGGEQRAILVAALSEQTLTTRAREFTVDTSSGTLDGGGEACFVMFGRNVLVAQGNLQYVQEHPTGDLDFWDIMRLAAHGAGSGQR